MEGNGKSDGHSPTECRHQDDARLSQMKRPLPCQGGREAWKGRVGEGETHKKQTKFFWLGQVMPRIFRESECQGPGGATLARSGVEEMRTQHIQRVAGNGKWRGRGRLDDKMRPVHGA